MRQRSRDDRRYGALTWVLGATAVLGLWFAVSSWPELQRYARIRRM